jgi:hypothetical protein
MKTIFLSILALYSLTAQAATLPPRDAAQFDDVSPEAIRTYLTSRSTAITKRTVGGVSNLSITSLRETLIKSLLRSTFALVNTGLGNADTKFNH